MDGGRADRVGPAEPAGGQPDPGDRVGLYHVGRRAPGVHRPGQALDGRDRRDPDLQHAAGHHRMKLSDAQVRVHHADAHRYRLGTHYEALPVNAPRCPVHHYHKDGPMRFFDNNTKSPHAYYEPNSFDGPQEDKRFAEPPLPLHGDAERYDHRDGYDDYTQAGNLFRLFDAEQKLRLFDNIAAAMQGVPEQIKRRQVALFALCDPAYGAGVAKALKLDPRGDDRLKGGSAKDEPQETLTAT